MILNEYSLRWNGGSSQSVAHILVRRLTAHRVQIVREEPCGGQIVHDLLELLVVHDSRSCLPSSAVVVLLRGRVLSVGVVACPDRVHPIVQVDGRSVMVVRLVIIEVAQVALVVHFHKFNF